MKYFTIKAIILAMISNAAMAEERVFNDPRATITPDSFTDVSVRLADDARNGCWTNLGEVKTYAEDKLELKGFTVVSHSDERPNSSDQAVMNVHIVSSRAKSGGCFGVIAVDLLSALIWDGKMSITGPVGLGTKRIFTRAQNTNILALETVDQFLTVWPQGIN